jgi:hypothetical protein
MSTPGDPDPEVPFAGEDDEDGDTIDEILEELREMPVGTNDPNIVGDAGPTDVPPGSDPPEGLDR